MDEQLKNLKRAMKKHTFSEVQFTEAQKQHVRAKMTPMIEQEILSLLHEPKTATELIQLLHVKGVDGLLQNEGIVFTILHRAEIAEELIGCWDEKEEKSYRLSKKGLAKYCGQTKKDTGRWSLKSLLQQVTIYEA